MEGQLQHIVSRHELCLKSFSPLSGGDINKVYLLNCDRISNNSGPETYVIKINNAKQFPAMFEAEAKGLKLLRSPGSFKIPKVIDSHSIDDISYLLIEYIKPGKPSADFWEIFAENLAILHRTTQPFFGLDHSNYIGSLPQINSVETSASDFYIRRRLEPQFKLARDKGFKFPDLTAFFRNVSDVIPNEPPALLHGDLWSGNYLVSEFGTPVLIDPAVAYAPREMDIAMMHLFGGFSEALFRSYNQIFPLHPLWKERISLWQLYYILVHLNLFGAGYFPKAKEIIDQYN